MFPVGSLAITALFPSFDADLLSGTVAVFGLSLVFTVGLVAASGEY